MTGRRALALLAALTALALAGCGIRPEPHPQPLPPGAVAGVSPTAAPSPTATRAVTVYLVDQEGRLRPVQINGGTGPGLTAALGTLLEVGATLPPPPDLRTLVPRGTALGRVVVYPDDVLVDLGAEFLGLSGPDQVLATAQVVFTATELHPTARVRLSVQGRTIPVPAEDGSLRDQPVRRADYARLAAQLASPAP